MLVDIFNKKLKINLELSDYCNAGCPLCARHKKGTSIARKWVNTGRINLAKFKEWFDPNLIEDISGIVICGNYGDPMTANELPEILEYINKHCNNKIYISIHTNGGLKGTPWWTKVGKEMSKFRYDSHIVFWLDGLEDTLHLYRRGVDYYKVIENAKTYMANGGKAHWGFLQFAHNEHQIDEVYRRANEMGFSKVTTKPVSGLSDVVEIDNEKVKRVKSKRKNI
jgi:MoaA/NifB/PqqE/SkfB family radical SAM enzyme